MLPEKILIIDDEKMIRLTTAILLKQHGIVVVEARTGLDGIELAKSEKPDLILLDIMMPGMDGWEVCDHLAANPATSTIPIVIFTAGDIAESEQKGLEKLVKGVIRKPFYIEQLLKICSVDPED